MKKTPRKPRPDLETTLDNLEFGDMIEINWIDACRAENVMIKSIGRNKVFATYKKTMGKFFAIKLDGVYHERFIIVVIDDSDPKRYVIESIPLACVKKITVFRPAGVFKHITGVGHPILGGGEIKNITGQVGEPSER